MYRPKKDRKDIDRYFLKILMNHPLLSLDQEQELLRKYKDEGNIEARNELVRHNLRYLVTKASRILKNRYGKISNEARYDIISAGVIQLIESAEGYSLEISKASNNGEPVRFLTYGATFVKAKMRRELWSSTEREQVGPKSCENYYKYIAAVKKLRNSGNAFGIEDIAKEADMPLESINSFEEFKRKKFLPLDKLVSDDEFRFSEVLTKNLDEQSIEDNREFLLKYVEELKPEEKRLIKLKYLQGELRSTKDVAMMIKITPTWARVIEKRAINHLRKLMSADNI